MEYMDLSTSEFSTEVEKPKGAIVDNDCDVVCVADMFLSQYPGGAEMTTEALLSNSPLKVCRLNSRDVTMETLSSGVDKFWIFTNISAMDPNLIPSIIANLKYSCVMYDYIFCKYRSLEKHKKAEGIECDCHKNQFGQIYSALLQGAKTLFWMSEKQMGVYCEKFPFLEDKNNEVLSSVFDANTLNALKILREKYKDQDSGEWCVLGSPSWVKGKDIAVKYCEDNGLKYKVLWGLEYDQMLEELAKSSGLVYLAAGADTAPRVTIEALLLGKKLITNKNSQHIGEDWIKPLEANIQVVEEK